MFSPPRSPRSPRGLFARLASDAKGNTLAIVAASTAPILAMVGGGIDMGRSYLAESRLQQACDAGVLAARKKLGSAAVVTGEVPDDVAEIGERFFNINFRAGAYGTENRQFDMTLEDDYSISATSSVDVPTTIMGIFGFTNVAVAAECQARLNFSNTDVMMVLDTTGSMAQTNPGDTLPKITLLKNVVTSFFAQLEAAKTLGTRVRYGFVPYSTNVNVGGLLKDEWVVNDWTYQSRTRVAGGISGGSISYFGASSPISGTRTNSLASTYPATFSAVSGSTCPTRPADALTSSTALTGTATEVVVGPPAGTRTTETYRRTRNGESYSVALNGSTCTVNRTVFTAYVDQYTTVTEPSLGAVSAWNYRSVPRDVTDWRTASNGCIEERKTYEITDYANVDLERAMDLDIDRVPTPGDPDTQWRPMYPLLVYDRAIRWDGSGSFSRDPVSTTAEFLNPGIAGYAACPPAAAKLQEFSVSSLTSFLAGLSPRGSTYHDIGMIWGGRLLSPTGIFAAENADQAGKPTSRNLIFLTDGQTAPLDVSYASYGVEPLERHRWSPASSRTLTQTVEARFTFACQQVRNKNITIWVIAFGTELSPMLADCAGAGHAFEASDAASLNQAFDDIAKSIGDLRISR